MKLKKILLSLGMALTFVFAFAFAGCSDCVTDSLDDSTQNRPVDPADPDGDWTDNY